MATTDMINHDPFCDVDVMPLAETGGKHGVIRLKNQDGNWEAIGTKGAIHGSDYRLVANSKIEQITQDILTRTGYDYKPLPTEYHNEAATNISWDGKKFASRWYIEDINGDVQDSALNTDTTIMLGCEAVNSYDGSHKVGINFYMMSMDCQNQFYSNNLLGGFVFNHYDRKDGSLDQDMTDAVGLIGQQAETFTKALPQLQKLISTPLHETNPLQGYLDIRSELQGPKRPWAPSQECHVLDELANNGITSKLNKTQTAHTQNLWGLLNAYTAVATHKVGGFNGANLSRYTTDNFIQRAAA